MQPLFSSTTTRPSQTSTASSATSSSQSGPTHTGLSGGDIAGIVIGAIVALVLAALLLFYCCIVLRRKRLLNETGLNQPSPPRTGRVVSMSQQQAPFQALPGARVTRMAALEGSSGTTPEDPELQELPTYQQSSSEIDSSPGSDMAPGVKGGPVAAAALQRRKKSNSGSPNDSSNYSTSGGEYSTPEGLVGRQSEQMPFFKDYYSEDDIHPNDEVSVLWAYQPQAPDEFELDRGEMLRIVGIWDDGWATGIRINDRAEDWDAARNVHRDSGVSNGSKSEESPPANGDLKAFPLVCVCLPQHWRKTLEGDTAQASMDPE